MDNSAIIVILNIWDIRRYNWLAAFLRETMTDGEEEEAIEEFWCGKYLKVKVEILPQKEDIV